MKLSTIAYLAFVTILGATPAYANFVPPMSLQRQFAEADLVVVARLGERTTCELDRAREPCVEILADVVLKGPPATLGVPRYLILSSSVSELRIDGIDTSGTKLMFLRGGGTTSTNLLAARPEFYSPVQSFRSILPVNDQNNR
jgi:hypothetical protein